MKIRISLINNPFSLCLMIATLVLLSPREVLAVEQIAGMWKHSAKPVLLRVDSVTHEMLVVEHNTNNSANGLTIIKQIEKIDNASDRWKAQMYNGYIDAFVPVELQLRTTRGYLSLFIFDSEGVEVLKVYRE